MLHITSGTYPNSANGKTLSAKGLTKAVNSVLGYEGTKDFHIDADVTIGELFTLYAMKSMENLMSTSDEQPE